MIDQIVKSGSNLLQEDTEFVFLFFLNFGHQSNYFKKYFYVDNQIIFLISKPIFFFNIQKFPHHGPIELQSIIIWIFELFAF